MDGTAADLRGDRSGDRSGDSSGDRSGVRLEPEHPWLVPALFMSEFDSDPAPARHRRSRRDLILDTGLTVVCALVAAFALFGRYVSDPPTPAPLFLLMVAGAVVSLAGVWVWRRFPVATTIVLAILCVVTPPVTPAAGALAFRTTVHRRLRVALVVTGIYTLSVLASSLVHPSPPLPFSWYAVICLVSNVALVGTASFVRARRQLLLSFAERTHKAEAEQRLRVEQARQGERNRIAREMHDVLAHRLSILSVQAGALEYNPHATREEVSRGAEIIRSSARQALVDLRQIVGVLRAPDDGAAGTDEPDRPQPTLADLPSLVAENRDAGMRLLYDAGGTDLAAVPTATGRSAYRIVQEALTNARKHAPDASVTVVVTGTAGGRLTLDVRNPLPRNKSVPSGLPGSGTGLVGLAERASLAGGTLTHGPSPAGEFVLHASLPWPP